MLSRKSAWNFCRRKASVIARVTHQVYVNYCCRYIITRLAHALTRYVDDGMARPQHTYHLIHTYHLFRCFCTPVRSKDVGWQGLNPLTKLSSACLDSLDRVTPDHIAETRNAIFFSAMFSEQMRYIFAGPRPALFPPCNFPHICNAKSLQTFAPDRAIIVESCEISSQTFTFFATFCSHKKRCKYTPCSTDSGWSLENRRDVIPKGMRPRVRVHSFSRKKIGKHALGPFSHK